MSVASSAPHVEIPVVPAAATFLAVAGDDTELCPLLPEARHFVGHDCDG
jgi:hypothetical protein